LCPPAFNIDADGLDDGKGNDYQIYRLPQHRKRESEEKMKILTNWKHKLKK